METRSYITRLFIVLSIIPWLFSCQKKDYDNSYTPFGKAYFKNQTPVNSNDLGVKFENADIPWNYSTGVVEAPEGDAKFTFYNTKTGAVIAEKKVPVSKANPPHYILWQPSDDQPVAFLDPNAQGNEEAAPANYMKIKIANLSKLGVPNENVDIVFQSTIKTSVTFASYDTVESVGRNMETAEYLLVNRAIRANAIQTRYKIGFLDATTHQPILAAGGAPYFSSIEFNTQTKPAPKGVYTIYLTDVEKTTVSTQYLKRGDKYYEISPNVLFND